VPQHVLGAAALPEVVGATPDAVAAGVPQQPPAAGGLNASAGLPANPPTTSVLAPLVMFFSFSRTGLPEEHVLGDGRPCAIDLCLSPALRRAHLATPVAEVHLAQLCLSLASTTHHDRLLVLTSI
jgi:hypothetical protein